MATRKATAKAAATVGTIEVMTLGDYAAQAWMKYALMTIEDRALPDNFDGMKPVQRRILWEMHKQKLSPSHEPVKSARVVGGTMGDYHPHGDSSIYGALVVMANLPVPIVDGRGNFGSFAETKPAAMRYTNCTLTPYGMTFLDPDYLAVAPMMPNYDEKDEEPVVLPTQLPNLFINGSDGVAVGLTCDIPPLEPVKLISLTQRILDGEDIDAVEAAKSTRLHYHYGGQLYLGDKESKKDWVDFWKTGFSQLWVMPEYTIDSKRRAILITGFPPGLRMDSMLESLQAHDLVESADDITDKRDKRTKVEVILKRARSFAEDTDEVIGTLFTRVHPKMNVIRRKHESQTNPADLPVKLTSSNPLDLLKMWCKLRVTLERKSLQYRIDRQAGVIRRTEMMILACVNRAVVLKSLESKDPDAYLSKALKIEADDAKMILDLPVRRLSTMDQQKLAATLKEQQAHLKQLNAWLKKPEQRIIEMMEEQKALFA